MRCARIPARRDHARFPCHQPFPGSPRRGPPRDLRCLFRDREAGPFPRHRHAAGDRGVAADRHRARGRPHLRPARVAGHPPRRVSRQRDVVRAARHGAGDRRRQHARGADRRLSPASLHALRRRVRATARRLQLHHAGCVARPGHGGGPRHDEPVPGRRRAVAQLRSRGGGVVGRRRAGRARHCAAHPELEGAAGSARRLAAHRGGRHDGRVDRRRAVPLRAAAGSFPAGLSGHLHRLSVRPLVVLPLWHARGDGDDVRHLAHRPLGHAARQRTVRPRVHQRESRHAAVLHGRGRRHRARLWRDERRAESCGARSSGTITAAWRRASRTARRNSSTRTPCSARSSSTIRTPSRDCDAAIASSPRRRPRRASAAGSGTRRPTPSRGRTSCSGSTGSSRSRGA